MKAFLIFHHQFQKIRSFAALASRSGPAEQSSKSSAAVKNKKS